MRRYVVIQNCAALSSCLGVLIGIGCLYAMASMGQTGPFYGLGWDWDAAQGHPLWFRVWPYVVDYGLIAFVLSNLLWMLSYLLGSKESTMELIDGGR